MTAEKVFRCSGWVTPSSVWTSQGRRCKSVARGSAPPPTWIHLITDPQLCEDLAKPLPEIKDTDGQWLCDSCQKEAIL